MVGGNLKKSLVDIVLVAAAALSLSTCSNPLNYKDNDQITQEEPGTNQPDYPARAVLQPEEYQEVLDANVSGHYAHYIPEDEIKLAWDDDEPAFIYNIYYKPLEEKDNPYAWSRMNRSSMKSYTLPEVPQGIYIFGVSSVNSLNVESEIHSSLDPDASRGEHIGLGSWYVVRMFHPVDTDQSRYVSADEMRSYIDDFQDGEVTLANLVIACDIYNSQ
ncbi:MAG: hypothetical protein ACLFPQ_03445 [Candidatus Woesearchaeota archaeon]